MADAYTHEKLTDVNDSAPKFGLAEVQEARFCAEHFGAERTGFAYFRMKPGARSPFGHQHEDAEEVYVVLRGAGRVKLDDEIREIAELDAIRVSPEVVRAFEAGPDGLDFLAFGARHDGDGELLPGWWSE